MKSSSILLVMQYSSSLNFYLVRLFLILLKLLRFSDCFINMELKMPNSVLKRCWHSFFQRTQVFNRPSSILTSSSTLTQLIMYKKKPRTLSDYLRKRLWQMWPALRSLWKNVFSKMFLRKKFIITYGGITLILVLLLLKMPHRCQQTS